MEGKEGGQISVVQFGKTKSIYSSRIKKEGRTLLNFGPLLCLRLKIRYDFLQVGYKKGRNRSQQRRAFSLVEGLRR